MVVTSSCGLFTSEDEEYSPEIVFSAEDKKGTPQIYTMNDDGSNVRRITNFSTSDGGVEPSWSPDGKNIVFSTTLQSTSNGLSLFIMNADGSDLRPMNEREGSDVPTPGNHAKWSPDGNKIVFQSCVACQVGTNVELFIYDFEVDSVIQLTDTEYGISNTNPVWSPDGTRIAFVSNRDYSNADSLRFRKDLYLISSDGSNPRRITETGFAREPVWHPVGNAIAFRSTGDEPGLHNLNLQDSSISLIKTDEAEKLHLHAHRWFEAGNKLLVTVFDLSSSNKNSIMIFDIKANEGQQIYSGTPINKADLVKY